MAEKSTRQIFFPDLYFESGGFRIDYILVISMNQVLSTEYGRNSFANYLDHLREKNIDMEYSHSRNPDLIFIKIHVPHYILESYADARSIDLRFNTPSLSLVQKVPYFKCRRTPLSYPDERSIIYFRAKETVGRKQPKKITQTERNLLTNMILQDARFGSGQNEISLDRLQLKGIVNTSYPLHEGPPRLTPAGPLNDRQLLAAYWSDIGNFMKEDPIDMIEKYFGPELAFYFAFVEFFNKALAWATIFSILLFSVGSLFEWKDMAEIRKDVCESTEYLCPSCDPKICKLSLLRDECDNFTRSHLYDTIGTFILSIFMSLWGTVTFELWKRKWNLFLMKWNLSHMEFDVTTRIGYEEFADVMVFSPVSGNFEPAMSKTTIFRRYLTISLIMVCLIGVVGISIVLSIMIKALISKYMTKYVKIYFVKKNQSFIEKCLGAFVQVIFIMLIDKVQRPAVIYMTKIENCRTQLEYDNSFIMKLWILGFINGFGAVFYSAFARGLLYTNPGDPNIYKDLNVFLKDKCGAAGCNLDLILLLNFLLIFKTLLVKCVKKVFMPILKQICRKKTNNKVDRRPQWEIDYSLGKMTELSILSEYAEIVGRLTMVIFWTAVAPWVPLLSLFCNYLEVKVDANAFVNLKRRPIPRKVKGLGVWYYILQLIIQIGVLINALSSALTKEYLLIVYLKWNVGTMDKYIDSRFSKYRIDEYQEEDIKNQVENLTYCLYNVPHRYPYDHPEKYKPMPDRFRVIAFEACFIVIYQHSVLFLTRLIAHMIPNTSADVREHIIKRTTDDKKILRKHFNMDYMARKN